MATKTTTSNTLEVPRRFSNQAMLESFVNSLNDDQFTELVDVLESRKWSRDEFVTRVVPMRTGHPALKKYEVKVTK
jgi:hypothetical protein